MIHLHTPDGTAVATSSTGLLPLNQTAQLVLPDLAYHDYEGVALDLDERPRLQRDLSRHNIMLLRNHGTLTVGPVALVVMTSALASSLSEAWAQAGPFGNIRPPAASGFTGWLLAKQALLAP